MDSISDAEAGRPPLELRPEPHLVGTGDDEIESVNGNEVEAVPIAEIETPATSPTCGSAWRSWR